MFIPIPMGGGTAAGAEAGAGAEAAGGAASAEAAAAGAESSSQAASGTAWDTGVPPQGAAGQGKPSCIGGCGEQDGQHFFGKWLGRFMCRFRTDGEKIIVQRFTRACLSTPAELDFRMERGIFTLCIELFTADWTSIKWCHGD